MLVRLALILTIIVFVLQHHRTISYKTWKELQTEYQKLENVEFDNSDKLVGKALDFMYSNRTIMSLLARELWNVGSRAIDKIVGIKGNKHIPPPSPEKDLH